MTAALPHKSTFQQAILLSNSTCVGIWSTLNHVLIVHVNAPLFFCRHALLVTVRRHQFSVVVSE